MSIELTSTAFEAGTTIPRQYTGDGDDRSPPLRWSEPPKFTHTLALICDDPDAPRGTWVHWVLFDLPATSTGLPEAVKAAALPAGTREGLNDWRRTGYGGPCPPIGRHRYFFKLYAVDVKLGEIARPTKDAIEKAMHGHVLASAELMGTYEKRRR